MEPLDFFSHWKLGIGTNLAIPLPGPWTNLAPSLASPWTNLTPTLAPSQVDILFCLVLFLVLFFVFLEFRPNLHGGHLFIFLAVPNLLTFLLITHWWAMVATVVTKSFVKGHKQVLSHKISRRHKIALVAILLSQNILAASLFCELIPFHYSLIILFIAVVATTSAQ